jgi:hypothetical protein
MLLAQMFPGTTYYSVLDLKDAFFYIPLHPKSQPIFAFEDPTRKSGQVTWTVLPQGFRDTPHLFGLALTQDLAEWQCSQATLLQYVDDLLLCGPSEPVISPATESLLNFLADRGYKISIETAQLCQSRVTYLGLVVEKETRFLGEDRIHSILTFPLPRTLKQLRAFLGVIGYCRIWILGYADLAKPLYQILKKAQKDTKPFIEWDDKSKKCFPQVKEGPSDSSGPGSPSTRQVSIICL